MMTELDHGAVVPLWHLVDAGWRGPAVLIGLNYPGEPGLVELGEAIAVAARRAGRRVALVASGDMSHRLQPGAPAGFHPRAKEFDGAFIECLRAGDYRKLLDFDSGLSDLAAEDALDSTLVAASAVNWNAAGHEVLSYEGPFGVGYGVAILHHSLPEDAPVSTHENGAAKVRLPKLARRLRNSRGARLKLHSAAMLKNRTCRGGHLRRAAWSFRHPPRPAWGIARVRRHVDAALWEHRRGNVARRARCRLP